MSALIVAFLVALSGGTWVYTKLQNKTGYGNSRNAAVGALFSAVILFIIVFTIGHMVLKSSN